MWGHLSEAALIDVIEGTAGDAARRHAEACERCRGRVHAARAGLELAEHSAVPEPAPFYWTEFRRQVERRLADEQPRSGRLLLRPALAALALLLAFASLLPRGEPQRGATQATPPLWSALPPLAEDVGFSLLQGLEAAEDDLLAASDASVTGLVAGLSDAESLDLALALEQELRGRRS